MKKQQRKYKSKRSVCIVTMVVVAIVIIVIGVCGREKKVETSKRKVMLGNWKQQGNEYHICTVEANGHEINCACSDKKWERFETELSLQEMAKQNKDFIKEITWHLNFGKEVKGNLYFAGNNYYVIYEDIETEDVTNDYIARCNTCEISYGFDIEYGVAPFPMEMTFDSGWQEKWVEEGNEKDYYSRFFDIFTFEEMCEYYGRYTDGTAQIDCDNQLIYVDVYDESSKLDENETALAEKFLCIDFQNQRFILNKGGDYEKIYEKRIKIVLSVFVVMIVLAVVGIYLYQNGYMKYAIEHPRTTEDSLLIKVGNMKRFLNKCKTNALSFMDKAFRYIINLYVICNIGFLQATMRITIFLSVESLV